MVKQNLRLALRLLLKNKIYAFIAIAGLSAGLSSTFLITSYVLDEISYDSFQSKSDRVFRIRYLIGDFDISRVPPVFKEHVDDFFPEIEKSSRFYSRPVNVEVKVGNKWEKFEEPKAKFADPEILEILDFELVSGSIDDSFWDENAVILNTELARKYFNEENPIGKVIKLEGRNSYRVVAVMQDFPSNSHTHFDMLLGYDHMFRIEPKELIQGIRNNFAKNWMVSHSPMYFLLEEGADASAVNERFKSFVKEKIPESMQRGQSFVLQPLLDIHLNDQVVAQDEPTGDRKNLLIFGAIGVLTLLIAIINFINLSTSKSLTRSTEIGVRKALGAHKTDLIRQHLSESFLLTFIASVISILVLVLVTPYFNDLAGKELSLADFFSSGTLLTFLVIFLMTGFFSGLYPSIQVVKFKTLESLAGKPQSGNSSNAFRRGLIVFQFFISIVLITTTLIVFQQLYLLRSAELGFTKEYVINIPIKGQSFNSRFAGKSEDKASKVRMFKSEVQKISSVTHIAASSAVPGFGLINRNLIPEGFTAEDKKLAPYLSIDYDFLDVYEMEVVAGRNFDKSYSTDDSLAFIINETAVIAYEFGSSSEAIGKQINLEGKIGKVVGVVSDFHFQDLTERIRPLILEITPFQYMTYSIKLGGGNPDATLEQIENAWNEVYPKQAFDFSFFDESLASLYDGQESFGKLIGYFSVLAIIISCMGSYGLIMFIAIQRQKEVGIRKVLGASILQVFALLIGRFMLPVLVAILLAIPVAYFLIDKWLSNFTYRVDISLLVFVLSSVTVIILVLLSISVQTFKASSVNPVQIFRTQN